MVIKKETSPPLLIASALMLFSSSSMASFPSFDRHKLEIDDKPEFKAIKSADKKKRAFINYFYPIIVNTNIDILKKRELIKKSRHPSDISEICGSYREDCSQKNYKQRLLSKVDVILPSMAIAQGALESGWGSSKYATKGNNFYGIYCYTPKCGLLKKNGANPKKYKDAADSISDYALTLNRHNAYRELRNIRKSSKKVDDWYRGIKKYSQKSAYPKMISTIVMDNDLKEVDAKMLSYFKKRNIYHQALGHQ